MAFKLPTPTFLKKGDKSKTTAAGANTPMTVSPKAAEAMEKNPARAEKKSGFSLSGIFGRNKKSLSSKSLGVLNSSTAAGARPSPSTNSGLGNTGNQSQKIAVAIAANKKIGRAHV